MYQKKDTSLLKFGGSSLASSAQVKKVIAIISKRPECNFIVVSAPGKRHENDIKVTDLLINAFRKNTEPKVVREILQRIKERYSEIAAAFPQAEQLDFDSIFSSLEMQILSRCHQALIESSGEHLMAQLIAKILESQGFEFLDARSVIAFYPNGSISIPSTQMLLNIVITDAKKYVIGGNYGSSTEDNTVMTIGRGGSDATASIIATALKLRTHENWTDVNGLLPVYVKNSDTAVNSLKTVSRSEARELLRLGASVLHPAAIDFISGTTIPIIVANTNDPDGPKTKILPDQAINSGIPGSIVGASFRQGLCKFEITRNPNESPTNFHEEVNASLNRHKTHYIHRSGNQENETIILDQSDLKGSMWSEFQKELKQKPSIHSVELQTGLTSLGIVGKSIKNVVGVNAKFARIIADIGVSAIMLIQNPQQISIEVIYQASTEKSNQILEQVYSDFEITIGD